MVPHPIRLRNRVREEIPFPFIDRGLHSNGYGYGYPAFGGSKKKKATSAYHPPVISSVTGNAITVSEENDANIYHYTVHGNHCKRAKNHYCRSKTGYDGERHNRHGSYPCQPSRSDRCSSGPESKEELKML